MIPGLAPDLLAARRRYVVPPELWPEPVTRTMDAAHLNLVANHPDVRPWLGGEGLVDLTGLVENPAHVGLITPHGGFVFVNLDEGRYEVHSLFLPEGRGAEAQAAVHAAAHYMFSATNCVEGLTKVATTNPAAAALTLRAGFERRFTGVVRWSPTQLVPHVFYELPLERWALRSGETARLGVWFHEAIEHVKVAWASTLTDHSEDDQAHNHLVGAAILMLRAGNARKAEAHYNRWARFSGYPLMRILAEHPVVIDLDGIIVEVHPDSMEILSCL